MGQIERTGRGSRRHARQKWQQKAENRDHGGGAMILKDNRLRDVLLVVLAILMSLPASIARAQVATSNMVIEAPELPLASAYLRTIEALDAEGYTIDYVGKTWLNRVIVRAHKGEVRREIVVSQSTGLVLRDIIFDDRTTP